MLCCGALGLCYRKKAARAYALNVRARAEELQESVCDATLQSMDVRRRERISTPHPSSHFSSSVRDGHEGGGEVHQLHEVVTSIDKALLHFTHFDAQRAATS